MEPQRVSVNVEQVDCVSEPNNGQQGRAGGGRIGRGCEIAKDSKVNETKVKADCEEAHSSTG